MSLKLYAHPFSSYCQKALIALYESGQSFQFMLLDQAQVKAEFDQLWPLKRFPLLVDGERKIIEATIIIEYLDLYYPGPRPMIPTDPKNALEARTLDRFFDNYISTPLQKIVFDHIRPLEKRDNYGVEESRQLLEKAYAWLDKKLKDREWAAGDTFTLADCSAAPALFYADWTHRIAPEFTQLRAYRDRLLARPSFARAANEARPYRSFFPLGAPNRD